MSALERSAPIAADASDQLAAELAISPQAIQGARTGGHDDTGAGS
jgi:hypothetical protein